MTFFGSEPFAPRAKEPASVFSRARDSYCVHKSSIGVLGSGVSMVSSQVAF